MSSISGVGGGYRPPPPKPPSFDTLDSDSSGTLSLDEFKTGAPKGADSAKSEALFKTIDSDSDGSISKAESDAFKTEAKKADQQLQSFLFGLQTDSVKAGDESSDLFGELDGDSDGSVAKDEFLSALSSGKEVSSDLLGKLFDAIDSNSDGALSQDETSAFQKATERRGPPPPPPPASFSASQAYGSANQLGASNASGSTYSQAA